MVITHFITYFIHNHAIRLSPPDYKDFKKTKEFSFESLITRLRIEEEARKQDQKDEV